MYSINNVTIYNFLCNKKNRTKRGIKVGGSSLCSNLNFRFNVFQNSNNKSVTNVTTYKLAFVLFLFFFFKLTTKLHKSSDKPGTVCTANGVHRLRGAGLGWRHSVRWAHLIHQVSAGGSIVHWKQHNIHSQKPCVDLCWAQIRKNLSEPQICLPNSASKTILQWKINGRSDISFKNQYQNCSTWCFFILLTCWQCWASEWWMVDASLIFASQDYDQTHTPTRSAYAHHEFIHNLQLFLFPSPINNNLARKEV